MNRLTLLAAAGALLATPALAAPSTSQIVLAKDLPNVPGMKMTELTVSYGPGDASGPHHHAEGGFLVAYVLKGSITSQVEGEAEHTYTVGQSWTEGPGAHHLISRNASATDPAQMLVVFVAPKDAVLTTPDGPAGHSH